MCRLSLGLLNGAVFLQMDSNLVCDRPCHVNGYGISNLFILGDPWSKKTVGIWERLESGGFTHRQGTVLVGQEHGPPMRIAFGHHCTCQPIIAEASVTLC